MLRAYGVQISMDGRGRFSDNIFVERLWRSLKYEEVYLRAYESVAEARQGSRPTSNSITTTAAPRLGYRPCVKFFEENVQLSGPARKNAGAGPGTGGTRKRKHGWDFTFRRPNRGLRDWGHFIVQSSAFGTNTRNVIT